MTLLYKELLVINKKNYHPNTKVGDEYKWRMHTHTLKFTFMIIKY